MEESTLTIEDLKGFSIPVVDPLSIYLQGHTEESEFRISLLDVVHFAGHCCPSMVGAFLLAQKVVNEFSPEMGVCVRGEISVDIGSAPTQGATGPISNVFGFIFGAWADSGFGGLNGQFVRRGLIRYSVADVPAGCFRFHHRSTGRTMDVSYNPGLISVPGIENLPFQQQWRLKIKRILKNHEQVVLVRSRNFQHRLGV